MKIKVTRKHIEDGVRHTADRCPIALALKDFGFATYGMVRVNLGSIEVCGATVSTPRKARQFITAFDKGKKVRPFTLVI